MAHSAIFRIIPVTAQVPDVTIQQEMEGWDSFPYPIDYVTDYPDEELWDNIQWLFANFPGGLEGDTSWSYNHINKTIQFSARFKELYFASKVDEIKDIVSQDDFQTRISTSSIEAFKLKELINDEFAFKVMDEYGGLETLDHFVRDLDPEKVYKIVQVADYHM